MKGSARLWAAACVAALCATAAMAVLLRSRAATLQAKRARVAADAGRACVVPDAVPLRPLPDADNPPVILWGVGGVRLWVDDQPAFSDPEHPKHYKVGEHTLFAEAAGAEPLKTRFRLDAFEPALFHALHQPGIGVSVVRLGAVCTSCPEAQSPVSLAYERAEASPAALMADAASALRRDEWSRAAARLRGVPSSSRGGADFHRLAAAVYADSLASAKARAELEAIPATASADLARLLKQLDGLSKSEEARRAQVVRQRWNKVTERFQALIERFSAQAPGPTVAASHELKKLSSLFDASETQAATIQEERLLGSAEKTLLSVVVEVRAAKPDDCDFQASVVATLFQ